LNPTPLLYMSTRGWHICRKECPHEAIGHLQKAVGLSIGSPWYRAELAYNYAAEGNRAQWQNSDQHEESLTTAICFVL
jgi:hypothetical protein